MANWYKDYTKTPVNITKLTMEIEDDGLTPNLLYIENDHSGSDNLRITFDAEVTGGELTTLDATVAAHDGAAATYYTIYCYDCGCAQGKRALAALTACPVCSGTDIQEAYHNDNLDATTNPTVDDDGTQGYCEGSMWMNLSLQKIFWCLDNTTGAAVWRQDPILETDGTLRLFNELRFYDPTGAEYATITRDLSNFTIDAGTGIVNFYFRYAGAYKMAIGNTTILFYVSTRPTSDNTLDLGSTDFRIANGHIVKLHHSSLYPTEIAQAEEPALAAGEMRVWRDTDDNSVYLIYNNPTAGQGKIEFIIP